MNRKASRRWRLGLAAALCVVAAAGAWASTAAQAVEHNRLGVEAYNAKDYDKALGSFLRAYELAPQEDAVRRNLANTYQSIANVLVRRSDFANAVEHLEMAVRVSPNDPAPLLQLGACRLRLNHVNEAIACIEEAVQLDPYSLLGHELLGDAYYRDDDLPSALAHWEWVYENRPSMNLQEKIAKATRENAVESEFRSNRSRHFEVRFAPDARRGDISRALRVLERAYTEIGLRFGGVYPAGPIQVKVYTAEDFSKATQLGEHVGAVYDGTIRIPFTDRQGRELDPAEMKRRLYHEYTHVVVRHVTGDNVPWWLNEGLAEEFSNELTPSDMDTLRAVYNGGNALPISALEQHQLQRLEPGPLHIAYLQSHATVRHLSRRYGQQRLRMLLDKLAQGQTIGDALHEVYRRDSDALDREVALVYGR